MEIKDMVQAYGNQAEEHIARDLNLRKKGKKYFCVFHDDGSTPNLSFDSNRNFYKCFACGKVYDIYDHLTEYDNLSEYDAAQKLKEMVGDTSVSYVKKEKKKVVKDTNAKNGYEKPKLKKADNKVLDYLKLRGFKKETLDYFEVSSKNGLIAIPYKNENGVNIGVKYRKAEKYKGK